MSKKLTYLLSSCTGRDPWSMAKNEECQRNGLTSCQVAQAEIQGQWQTMKNVKEIDLLAVKLHRQRSRVNGKEWRMSKKLTYLLSSCTGRDPASVANNEECQRNQLTCYQVAQAEIQGQWQAMKNVKEIDLHPVKLH